MKSFNVLALDSNYEIVSLLRYTSLQWNRKYHEAGNFCIEIPLKQYSSSWEYIYTKERPELGKITQVNYVNNNNYKSVYVSGNFLEEELNRMVVYSRPKHFCQDEGIEIPIYHPICIMNGMADWLNYKGTADVVAHAFFNAFKVIRFKNYDCTDTEYDGTTKDEKIREFMLDIQDGSTESGSYKISDHYRNNEQLGYKIYDILKPSGASYRVSLDFLKKIKTFNIIIGKDRRSGNDAGNNPIVFSTKYGNIKNPNVLISNTDVKDAVVQTTEYKTGTDEETEVIVLVNALPEAEGRFLYKASDISLSDYTGEDVNLEPEILPYKYAGMVDAKNELANYEAVVNVEFDAMEKSYEYGVDFDIGDYCSIEIPEIELSAEARLIGCYEVVKGGQWSMTMEFGTPILIKK